MKKTQKLEANRNIKDQLSSFISIVVIAMLAVTVYLGIAFSARAMDVNISGYYNRLNMQDLVVYSPLLMTADDAEVIRAVDGVAEVEGGNETVAWLPTDSGVISVSVITLAERVAVPEIISGHAPQNRQECMVENLLAKQTGLQIGDTVRLKNKSGSGNAPLLTESVFTVTGLFQHPDHITDKIDITKYVIVDESVFDQDLLEGNWLRLRVRMADMPQNRFTKSYTESVDVVQNSLNTLSEERVPIRADQVRASLQQRVDDGESQLAEAKVKLDDAEQQLADGRQQLADGQAELSDGEKQIQDAEQQILDGEKQLADAQLQITDGEQQLADAQQKLSDGEQQLSDAEQQISDGEKQLNDAEQQLKDGEQQLKDAEQQISDGEKQLKDAEQQLKDGEQQLKDGEEKLKDGEKQLKDGEQQLKDGEQQLKDAELQIADGEKQLADAEQQISDGEKQLKDAEQQINDAKAKYADKMDDYEAAMDSVAEAEHRLGLAPGQLAEAERKLADGKAQLDSAGERLDRADALLTEMERIHDDPAHRSEQEVEDFGRDALAFVKENFSGDQLPVDAIEKYLKALEDSDDKSLEEAYQILDDMLRDGLDGWEQLYREKQAEYERGRNDYYYSGEQYLDGLLSLEKAKKMLAAADDAMQQLKDAEQQLDEKRAELESGKQEFNEKKAELDSAKQEFSEKKAEYERGRKEFEEKKAELESGRQEFEEKKAELESGRKEFEEKKAELESAKQEFSEKKAELESGRKEFEEKKAELDSAKQEYAEKKAEFDSGKQEFDEKKAELDSAKQEFSEKKAELEDAKQQLAEKRQELEDGRIKLEDGRRELEEKQAEYDSGLTTYREKRDTLDQLKEYYKEIDSAKWTVLDNSSNGSFVYARANSSNLSSLSSTFSLLFVAIAALVIYASVARMVDEQSILVGTTKALGFYNKEVMAKYLIFGVRSTLLGVIAGILLAYFVLQTLCLNMYAPYYTVPKAPPCFLLGPSVLLFVGGLALAVAAVLIASYSLMKSTAVTLMKGKEPKQLFKTGKSSKSSSSLYTRLILLNMGSDLTRVIVTIVSIAGCCILLMVGFTLKFGEDRVVQRQYGEVMTFDAELTFDPDNPEAAEKLKSLLDSSGVESILVYQDNHAFSDGDSLSACKLISAEPDALPGWYNLRDENNESLVTESEHGVLITKRMHETLALNPGDTITFYNESMSAFPTEVTGIFNNYFGQISFASQSAFREIFGTDPVPNCFFIKLNGFSINVLRDDARWLPGFISLEDAAARRAQIESTAKAMDVLIIVMIVAAGLMAWFILDNLSGSYMLHKKKELTVMRVNGFTTKECVRYAASELIITTVLGILLGVPLGAQIGYRVIRLTEQSFLQMDRTLDIRSVIFSALITAVFALIINGRALSRIRDLKLSDAAN